MKLVSGSIRHPFTIVEWNRSNLVTAVKPPKCGFGWLLVFGGPWLLTISREGGIARLYDDLHSKKDVGINKGRSRPATGFAT
jgi:hypothetical protein